MDVLVGWMFWGVCCRKANSVCCFARQTTRRGVLWSWIDIHESLNPKKVFRPRHAVGRLFALSVVASAKGGGGNQEINEHEGEKRTTPQDRFIMAEPTMEATTVTALKPGQKFPTPTPGFGDRVFYETLLKQRPDSEMAQEW